MTKNGTGWIPTHDGERDEFGRVNDPYIRSSDSYGPIRSYFPYFTDFAAAKSWCCAIGAVPIVCDIDEAMRIAHNHDAELQVT